MSRPAKNDEGAESSGGEEEQVWVTRSGMVLTEEIAEQMAEEIEREPPDPEELEPEIVGRPKIFLKSGRELTPELEDELAAEAERGYDLSKARWRIRTRPLLPGSPLPEIALRLSQEECDDVCRRAEDEGRPVSDVLQEALEQE